MVTHTSILAWRIPWTEEPGGLSPQGHKQRRLKWLISSDGHTYVFTYTDVYVYTCALGEFTHTHDSLKNYILLLSSG